MFNYAKLYSFKVTCCLLNVCHMCTNMSTQRATIDTLDTLSLDRLEDSDIGPS